MNDKQKKIIIIASVVSVIAGAGLFVYFRLKNNGITIKVPFKYDSRKK